MDFTSFSTNAFLRKNFEINFRPSEKLQREQFPDTSHPFPPNINIAHYPGTLLKLRNQHWHTIMDSTPNFIPYFCSRIQDTTLHLAVLFPESSLVCEWVFPQPPIRTVLESGIFRMSLNFGLSCFLCLVH